MRLKIIVKPDIDTKKILARRGLGASHDAAKYIAGVIRKFCDPYVPMDQGMLKNTSQVVEAAGEVYILYNQPYAHYQYMGEIYGPNVPIRDKATGEILGFFSNPNAKKQPTGRPLTYSGAPMRGKEWDKRMMADRGDEVRRELARYVGGKYK